MHFLFGSRLSGHILEGDAYLVTLFVHLGFALAHAEDTCSATGSAATHAPHEKNPHGHQSNDGEQRGEKIDKEAAFLVLVRKILNLARLLHLGEIFLQLVGRTELYTDVWILPSLLGIHIEDVAHMGGLDIHLERALAVVHHHVVGISFVYVFLEFGVGGLLFGTAGHKVSTSVEEECCRDEDEKQKEPAHVEPRHLGLLVIRGLVVAHNFWG